MMAQTTEHSRPSARRSSPWRLHVLVEAGYPLTLAEKIAHSEADLHRAVELVLAGCSHHRRRDPALAAARIASVKVEATEVDGRKVFSVRAFIKGVASWLERLPTVWVEGEVTELRRQERWASVFFTLKDPDDGASLAVQMQRGAVRRARLDLADGERVHVYGRPELYEQRGDCDLRALTIERYGLGAHLAALERLKQKLAAEGLFAADAQAPAPPLPAADRARDRKRRGRQARRADRDRPTRFPPAHVLVAETYVQGPRAARRSSPRSATCCRRGVDVLVLARGGGSFEDLLPSRTSGVVRAVAACAVPVVSAVGPRAGHAALRPRRRRPRIDADRGRAARRTGRCRAACRARPVRGHAAPRCGRRRGTACTATRGARERLGRAPLLALERRRACSTPRTHGSSRWPRRRRSSVVTRSSAAATTSSALPPTRRAASRSTCWSRRARSGRGWSE